MAKTRTVARSHLILVMLSSLATSQAPPAPTNPSNLLERARTKLMLDMSRQSRYTCVQNIARRFYDSRSNGRESCSNVAGGKDQKRSKRLVSSDSLRLDVAIADNQEVHSWPGANRFDEAEIRESVSGGSALGSGDFAAFIVGIFGGSAELKFAKSTTVNGRLFYEYVFEVPQGTSNYVISDTRYLFTTAYGGSFLLDQGGDLVQLTVRTAELPPLANACQATSEIRYERIAIHGHDVLVPQETELRTIFRDGTLTVGTTSYSNCHEYASRSVIRFDLGDVAIATTSQPVDAVASKEQRKALPLGLIFQCRIMAPLGSGTQAGGVIQAVLSTPLLGESGEILAPLGAHIRARLLRLAHYTRPHDYFEADVRLDTIDVNGTELQLYAVPAHEDLGTRVSEFVANGPRNVGAFFFDQKHLNVRQWDSTWMTTARPPARRADEEKSREASHAEQNPTEKDSVQNFILALQYAKKASDLQNATVGTTKLKDSSDLALILSYRQKAIDAGRAVNLDHLNDLYPSLGNRFSSQFLDSLILFVHSCNIQANSESVAREELSRSILLFAEWVNWYEPLRSVIDTAVRSSVNSPTHQ